MKTISNVFKLTLCFLVMIGGWNVAGNLGSQFGLASLKLLILQAAFCLPGIALHFLLDGDWRKNLRALLSPVSAEIWVWRAVSVVMLFSGLFLGLGNRSGRFPTFPFAGTLVCVVAAMIFTFKGSAKNSNKHDDV